MPSGQSTGRPLDIAFRNVCNAAPFDAVFFTLVKSLVAAAAAVCRMNVANTQRRKMLIFCGLVVYLAIILGEPSNRSSDGNK